ncbi:hypothetical protein GALMADRAFT_1349818 [Galerina marginata CBS 339.88]|uniref:Restriction of telomere capping protein 4 n=1 Tax=Galerina marginata (strain CBS 339.88) TaxID=685588 RepID=A0A067SV12_GALM3|nr:hypothetical protein GALMADRAFT_1349818 [Galerina marginata CBS 339.88]
MHGNFPPPDSRLTMADPPDPVIQLVQVCSVPTCRQPMGPLKVYKGQGDPTRQHLRGSVVQLCSIWSCSWTYFHTHPFKFCDAEALVQRLTGSNVVQRQPPSFRPPSPNPPVAASQNQHNRIDCTNQACTTKNGSRTQGSKNCVERKCRNCCIQAYLQSEHDGISREKCASTHPTNPGPWNSSTSAWDFSVNTIFNTSYSTEEFTPQAIIDAFATVISSSSYDNFHFCTSSSSWNGRKRDVEITENSNTGDGRGKAPSCLLVVYFKNGEPPLKLQYHVQTFPNLRLSGVSELVNGAKLTPESRIDYYNGEPWTMITINTVIQVERDQREIQLQPSRRPATNKQSAQLLVSPPAKVPCLGPILPTGVKLTQQSDASPLSLSRDKLQIKDHDADIQSDHFGSSSRDLNPRLTNINARDIASLRKPKKAVTKKLWPVDYYVFEYAEGTRKLEAFVRNKKTEKDSFTLAFSGIDYKKTTDADPRLKDKFIAYGKTEKGLFKHFYQEYESAQNLTLTHNSQHSPTPSSPTANTTIQGNEATKTNFVGPAHAPLVENPITSNKETLRWLSDDSALDDAVLISSDNLCPFCDQQMEGFRSPRLDSMLTSLWIVSSSMPNHSNVNHRVGAPAIQVSRLCHQHHLESKHFPQALREKWPFKVDLTAVYDRIKSFEEELLGILEEPNESAFFTQATSPVVGPSPQWDPNAVQSAGYYGDEGYQLILVSLRSLFPPDLVDLEQLAPLSYMEVIRKVLLPEAAILLIHQDLRVPVPVATQTLHESQDFGSIMHPCDSESPAFIDLLKKTYDSSTYPNMREHYRRWVRAESTMDFCELVDDKENIISNPTQLCAKVNDSIIDPLLRTTVLPEQFPNLPSPPLNLNFSDPSETAIPELLLHDAEEDKDPSHLCPFCDEKLPENPSETLTRLREFLETRTWPDPMPDNRLHRSAPSFETYIHFCTRHQFESKHLPLAKSAGWPMDVDFAKVFDQVCHEYPSLVSLLEIENNKANEFLTAAKEHYEQGPSRLQGVFGQFERSTKLGAGYYGEAGYQLVLVAIRHLFPRSSIDATNIHPLTYDVFTREVLALEAVIRLIQVDLKIGRKEALQVFNDSHSFGNNMHDSSSPEIEHQVQNAVMRAQKSAQIDASVHRSWAASGSGLSIFDWVQEQKQRAVEVKVKQEEKEVEFPGYMQDAHSSLRFKGSGLDTNPIDLTME